MTSQQLVGLVASGAIDAGLIAFVLYRGMRPHQRRLRRLVLLPAVLGLFALVSRVSRRPQGPVIGELLLALAVTFAAQNAVLWLRSSRLTAAVAGG